MLLCQIQVIMMAQDGKLSKKVNDLKELAVGSIFFPFTEPRIKSPLTGKYVGGEKNQKDKVQNIIDRLVR